MKINTVKINDHQGVTLTSYIQDQSKEMTNVDKRPAILIFPGGGYQFCSDREAEPIALSYMAKGYNAFVLRYSLNENAVFPKPLNDAEDALEHLISHAETYRIYPDKIAVIGFSAGGHLACSIATQGRLRPNAVILGYPALIKRQGWSFPTPIVDQDTPEMFVFHTFEDPVVPLNNALYIVDELNKANIKVEFHVFRSGTHGLSLGNDIVSNGSKNMIEERYQAWFDLSISWLDEVLNVF